MKQLDLKPVGLTDRMEHNATAANFAQIEDAFNSNAITAEGMYAELNGKLATEAQTRVEADKELDGKIRSPPKPKRGRKQIKDWNNGSLDWSGISSTASQPLLIIFSHRSHLTDRSRLLITVSYHLIQTR